jgi:hypothetical protein
MKYVEIRSNYKHQSTKIENWLQTLLWILSQVVGGCVVMEEAVIHESRPVKMVGLWKFVFWRVVTLKKKAKRGAAMALLGGWALTLEVNENVGGRRWMELAHQC